jgi:hypothetical protein
MSKWRKLAVELFPEYNRGSFAFQRGDVTIYWVFFELLYDLDNKIAAGDTDWLRKVFYFVEWCFNQRKRNGDIWNAAATAFLEHMADEDSRAELIPMWVKPEIFADMWDEFRYFRERKWAGKAKQLLEAYNAARQTDFKFET